MTDKQNGNQIHDDLANSTEKTPEQFCTAFVGGKKVAQGNFESVVIEAKHLFDLGEESHIIIFADETAQPIDADLSGTVEDVQRRLDLRTRPKAGRPKLGVVSREVTLLPRHWDYLNAQPGGASVAIRKLVEAARRENADKDQLRLAQEATYRFISATAGNEVGFEEATRALFAGKHQVFDTLISTWPADVQTFAQALAVKAFAE